MRPVLPVLLPVLLLLACAPAVADIDGPATEVPRDDPDTGDDDDDTADPYAYVRCDGSYRPAVPSVDTRLRLAPDGTPLDEATWSPALEDHALDPTTDAFDPVAALPDAVLDLAADPPWPTVPEDPTDLRGALLVETRFDEGPWVAERAIRLDDVGRMLAEYTVHDGRVRSHARFMRRTGDVWTEREVFLRGSAIASVAQRRVVEGDGVRYELHQQYPQSVDWFEGDWRRETERIVIDGPHPGMHGVPLADLRLTHEPRYEEVNGRWLRWQADHEEWSFDDDDAVRTGAMAHAYNNRLASGVREVHVLDGGRTSVQVLDSGQVITTLVCPSEDEAVPPDRLVAWSQGDGPWGVVTSRQWSGPQTYEDLRDDEADGTWDSGQLVEREADQEAITYWTASFGARFEYARAERRYSAGGVLLEERLQTEGGVTELRVRGL